MQIYCLPLLYIQFCIFSSLRQHTQMYLNIQYICVDIKAKYTECPNTCMCVDRGNNSPAMLLRWVYLDRNSPACRGSDIRVPRDYFTIFNASTKASTKSASIRDSFCRWLALVYKPEFLLLCLQFSRYLTSTSISGVSRANKWFRVATWNRHMFCMSFIHSTHSLLLVVKTDSSVSGVAGMFTSIVSVGTS